MKNKTLPIVAIIIMVFLGACNTDDDLLVNNPEQTRTLTLTASMPDDGPTTRIALEKNDDNTIALTWEATDKLQLLFVQNDFKEKTEAAVKNITEDGKKAQFDIVLPSAITEGDFTLYGVYGAGGLDEENPANVILPANPGNASSLEDVQTRKDLVLYFESANIDVANPKVTVLFQHLGSLFNITLKNTAATNLENIKEVRLVGVGGDGKWAYNSNEGAQTYNLLTGEFENQGTAGNYISFSAASTTVLADEEINFWGWYPPLPEKHWPELKLELWNETTATATSINSK
ncbi:MAG: fimbrillin family protein, partial [Bacteroidales bacterium]|nr:fimbrillin family protein [Bacteroidales bacterium]